MTQPSGQVLAHQKRRGSCRKTGGRHRAWEFSFRGGDGEDCALYVEMQGVSVFNSFRPLADEHKRRLTQVSFNAVHCALSAPPPQVRVFSRSGGSNSTSASHVETQGPWGFC